MASPPADPLASPETGEAGPSVPAELLPGWDPGAPGPVAANPGAPGETDAEVPMALPVRAEDVPAGTIPVAPPVEEGRAATQVCTYCKAPRAGDSPYCLDCGLMFPTLPELSPRAGTGDAAETGVCGIAAVPSERLAERYQCAELMSTRGSIARFRGLDFGAGESRPVGVVLVRMPLPADTQAFVQGPDHADTEETGIGLGDAPPTADPATGSFTDELKGVSSRWPGLGWERSVLQKVSHPAVPRLLDHFEANDFYYVVEESPNGLSLWDAWDDPSISPRQTFEWLAEVAEALVSLHAAGATLEGIRPDIVVIKPDGHAALTDLSDLLPLPVPSEPLVQATPYTAPELVLASEEADARAALYSFGAMLYALHLGRELTELDFVRQGVPKPFVPLFPDAHPALARIVMKTFVRDKALRFPTEDAFDDDPTGFSELIHTLRVAAKTLSDVRLDIASWTSIGMARTSNEDAFALLHAVASERDQLRDEALLILADGMGGVEAGEIASAMAITSLRQRLLQEPCFAGFTAAGRPVETEFNVQDCQELFRHTLVDVNREIHEAARTPGKGKPGMGCTAEVVYVRGRQVVVGHVGDSRTYHYSGGRTTLLTRDQTLVNRLMELGHLTPEEADTHPRKHELQQALGGQPGVDPATYECSLKPGDWLIVCSDGLTNHVEGEALTEMIQESDAAETCARRLVNLANLQGGADNCSVIAVRVT